MEGGRYRPGAPEREHPRVTVDAFVRIHHAHPLAQGASGGAPGEARGGREFVFRVRDLSVGGMFLYTRVGHLYPFAVGTPLQVELYDFDEAVEFRAVIVRIVDTSSTEAERYPLGFGVKIAEIDEANRTRLERLIARVQSGQPIY